ncbi:MAG: endonuclease III [Candidatus Paceibacterota bacterium]
MKKKESKKEFERRKKRAVAINKKLKELFPSADTELNQSNPWELLVAVVLSAQCTDKQVNKVTKTLFKKYKTLDDYIKADREEFEQDIRSTGFYKNKTKNILASAKKVKADFGGKVPKTMQELLTLPGVARKSANIILSSAYGHIEGIAVDTHVKRLANKFQLSDESDPNKIERDLMAILPRQDWMDFSFRMVLYGREYSTARKKDARDDPISKLLAKKNFYS